MLEDTGPFSNYYSNIPFLKILETFTLVKPDLLIKNNKIHFLNFLQISLLILNEFKRINSIPLEKHLKAIGFVISGGVEINQFA